MLLLAFRVVISHRDAIAKQPIHLPVGGNQAHGLAALGQLGQCGVHHRLGNVRIQPNGGGFELQRQQHLTLVLATRAIVQIRRISGVTNQHIKTTHMLQALQQRLFNLVFGDEVRHRGRILGGRRVGLSLWL